MCVATLQPHWEVHLGQGGALRASSWDVSHKDSRGAALAASSPHSRVFPDLLPALVTKGAINPNPFPQATQADELADLRHSVRRAPLTDPRQHPDPVCTPPGRHAEALKPHSQAAGPGREGSRGVGYKVEDQRPYREQAAGHSGRPGLQPDGFICPGLEASPRHGGPLLLAISPLDQAQRLTQRLNQNPQRKEGAGDRPSRAQCQGRQ